MAGTTFSTVIRRRRPEVRGPRPGVRRVPVTADLYPAATGLIEGSAAAHVSGVPEDAADDGFFGPASITWRVLEARQRIALRMRTGRPV